jgi:hypothetical protein
MSDAKPDRRHVIPPAVQAARMQRYSVYLMVLAFIIVGANFQSVTPGTILWFAAGITVTFSLLCAITVVILHAIAWNFDRLRDEWAGQREAREVGSPDPQNAPRVSQHALTELGDDAAGPPATE